MTRARAVLAVTASVVLLLTGCIGPLSKSIDLMYRVDFSQYQAVPGFDDAQYRIDEGPELEAFQKLLRDHDVEPWTLSPVEDDGCTGGMSTTLKIYYYGAGITDLIVDGCGAEAGSFEADLNDLFAAFREAHAGEGFENHDIVAIAFSQSQAVQGFDDAGYTQDDPAEVARFVDLLERFDILWSDGNVDSGESCPGSISSQVTAVYEGTDLVVGPVVLEDCSADDTFPTDASALLTFWRETLSAG
jgi:hypothetical protein